MASRREWFRFFQQAKAKGRPELISSIAKAKNCSPDVALELARSFQCGVANKVMDDSLARCDAAIQAGEM